jgi:methyl-accepting chemotaxis protein
MTNLINHLQFKISAALILLTSLVLTGLGFHQYLELKADKLAHLANIQKSALARLEKNLANPLWNFDFVQAEETVLSEMHEETVFAIIVKDGSQRLLTAKVRDQNWQPINVSEENIPSILQNNQMLINVQKEISFNKETVGSVQLYITQQFMIDNLTDDFKQKILSLLLVDLTIFLFLYWIIRRLAIRPLQYLLSAANTIASGDFRQTIIIKQHDEIGQLAHALQMMVAQLQTVIIQVKIAASNVSISSQQMSESLTNKSQEFAVQSSSIEQISFSIKEMTDNIKKNTQDALKTEEIALAVAHLARNSSEAVKQTVIAMQEIVKKIVDIQDITKQTRMLSINAAIEASHARQFGSGFAIVATEIRMLAEHTQKATEDISQLINNGVEITQNAQLKINELLPHIENTSHLVQSISCASRQHNQNAALINQSVQHLDEMAQHNSATSEELSSTAEELAAQAEQLKEMIAFFKIPKTSLE